MYEYSKEFIEKEVGEGIFEKAYLYLRGSQLAGVIILSVLWHVL